MSAPLTSPAPSAGAHRSLDDAPPAVEVRDLRRRYGDFEAVRGISFDAAGRAPG